MNLIDPMPIFLQLWDKDPSKFVRATVRLPDGAEVQGSPFSLSHVAGGYYAASYVEMPEAQFVTVLYEVFDDPARTIASSTHDEAFETLFKSDTAPITVTGGGGDLSLEAVVSDVDLELFAVVDDVSWGMSA